eukprot:gnl/Chilomastix_caulleri/7459.p2 GENE.gnl/Chilomastix_caulleri/7459~~gnl/Chilomastix_caulleri/7459.p2  ORF type:complete len:60 (+),score=14.65 gnl/Chilomastix_caulleri/7459:58-237(+)
MDLFLHYQCLFALSVPRKRTLLSQLGLQQQGDGIGNPGVTRAEIENIIINDEWDSDGGV